jgi:hypothetical protein
MQFRIRTAFIIAGHVMVTHEIGQTAHCRFSGTQKREQNIGATASLKCSLNAKS